MQKSELLDPCPILTMNVNKVTMIFGVASGVIYLANDRRQLYTVSWQPL